MNVLYVRNCKKNSKSKEFMKTLMTSKILSTVYIALFLFSLIGHKFVSIDDYIRNTNEIRINNIKILKVKKGYKFFSDETFFEGTVNGNKIMFKYIFYPFKSHYVKPISNGDSLKLYVNSKSLQTIERNDFVDVLPLEDSRNILWQEKESIQKYLFLNTKILKIVNYNQLLFIGFFVVIILAISKLVRVGIKELSKNMNQKL